MHMQEKSQKWGLILIILAVAILAGGGIYYFLKGKPKFVSPIPAEPSFKVIYYTPTPGPVTPSSTPSATPKVKATPAKVVPTKSETTPTVTPKATATPTP